MHKTAPTLIVLALLAFVGTVTARQAHDTTSVKQVMLTMTIPASDVIFTAASEPPKDEQTWQDLRKNVLVLNESGQLLLSSRLAKDNGEWVEMARAMITQATVTLKATDAKDLDALAQAADDLYVTCKTCHDRYME